MWIGVQYIDSASTSHSVSGMTIIGQVTLQGNMCEHVVFGKATSSTISFTYSKGSDPDSQIFLFHFT